MFAQVSFTGTRVTVPVVAVNQHTIWAEVSVPFSSEKRYVKRHLRKHNVDMGGTLFQHLDALIYQGDKS